MEGKRADQKTHDGTITALLDTLAIVSTSLLARRLTNVQLELIDKQGRSITDQLYGKIVEIDESAGSLKINFTSIPPEAEKTFRHLLEAV